MTCLPFSVNKNISKSEECFLDTFFTIHFIETMSYLIELSPNAVQALIDASAPAGQEYFHCIH